MKTELLHVGMKVRHPQHGVGTVESVAAGTTDVRFDDGLKTIAPEMSEIQPADPLAHINGLDKPLEQLVQETVQTVLDQLGIEQPDSVSGELGSKWNNGTAILQPGDPSLQSKEIPLEAFFHKIVMIRNNLRVLEQKINGHKVLTDGDKFDLQQYITRSYGSMTTFNVFFKDKEEQFSTK